MNYLSQSMLRVMTIASLFAAAQTNNPGRQASQIAEYIKNPVGVRRVSLALDELVADNLVEDIGDTEWIFALTASGYGYAERMYLSEEHPNFKFVVDGLVDSFQQGNNSAKLIEIDESENAVPAADRFVQIGHNTPGYQDALENAENALDAIRKSNSIDPEQRSWILPNLQVGIDAIRRGGNLLVSGLETFLLNPLKSALKGIAEERLKAAISVAIAAIRNLIGI